MGNEIFLIYYNREDNLTYMCGPLGEMNAEIVRTAILRRRKKATGKVTVDSRHAKMNVLHLS